LRYHTFLLTVLHNIPNAGLAGGILDIVVDKKLRPIDLQDASELERLLMLFSSGYHAVFTSKTKKTQVVEKGPDDDKFIECARH
jgi:hypothetical protein